MIDLNDIVSIEIGSTDDVAMDGWEYNDPLQGHAGWYIDGSGNKQFVDINDQYALRLANDQKTDGIFQFDTDLAKCVRYDSKISLKDGVKRIDSLNPAKDHIKYLSSEGPKYTNNYEVKKSGVKPLKKISLDNGVIMFLTGEHRVLTKNGYMAVDELKVGDEIIEINDN